MEVTVKAALQKIGRQLDENIFPRVKSGGIVMPSEPAVSPLTLGVEKSYDKASRQRRPKSRSWERTSGGQRPARGPWPPGQTAPVVRTGLQAQCEDELNAVHEAYPGTRAWRQEEGLWLLTESSLLPGLLQRALFLTAISFSRAIVRSWGFWENFLAGPVWIGPRHTNFPDGSICAFEPTDGTWVIGGSMVELLDLYTLWALRHLHLQVFGRWPGRQAVHYPYERILELREDEYCGCGKSDELYGECCRDKDLARSQVADAVHFITCAAGGLRKPPDAVMRFARERIEPPRFSDLLVR